jgi:hypothetical protein
VTPGECRAEVLARDRVCQAPTISKQAGTCFNRWGGTLLNEPQDLEIDFIRNGAIGKRHELPCDHVALCPGHHRGTGPQRGYVWATANRELLALHLLPLRRVASLCVYPGCGKEREDDRHWHGMRHGYVDHDLSIECHDYRDGR